MMKKLLFLIAFIMGSTFLHAQFMGQTSGLANGVGLQYMHAVNANLVWANGFNGIGGIPSQNQTFTHTTDGGNNWTGGALSGYAQYGTAMIFGLNATTAFIPIFDTVNNGGKLLKTTDGGTTWVVKKNMPAPSFPDIIHFFNDHEGILIGDPLGGYFEIYLTTDTGTTWTRVPSANIPAPLTGTTNEFAIVGYYSAVGNTVWFGTNYGRVFKSVDKGLHWTAVQTPISGMSHYIQPYFLDLNHGVIIERDQYNDGLMYQTLDGGATWAFIYNAGPYYTYGFSWVPGMPQTCVTTSSSGTTPGISYSYDGGASFTNFVVPSGQFQATAWIDNSTGWAGCYASSAGGGVVKYSGVLTDLLKINPKEGGVKIYPNPSSGKLTCAIVGYEGKNITINIYNALGQKVYENHTNQGMLSYNETIDLSSLGKGLYVAEVQCGSKVYKQKLTVE